METRKVTCDYCYFLTAKIPPTHFFYISDTATGVHLLAYCNDCVARGTLCRENKLQRISEAQYIDMKLVFTILAI